MRLLSFQVLTHVPAMILFDVNILIIIILFSTVIRIVPLALEFCGELANN